MDESGIWYAFKKGIFKGNYKFQHPGDDALGLSAETSDSCFSIECPQEQAQHTESTPSMRGRPPGSKNKEVPVAPDLLVIPRRIKKEITTLSAASGVSPAQVLVDILDGGLINARAMYSTLIEYRKSLREQLDERVDGDEEANADGASGEAGSAERNGSTHIGVDPALDVVGDVSVVQSIGVGSDLAPVGPGREPEGDEALNGDRGDAS